MARASGRAQLLGGLVSASHLTTLTQIPGVVRRRPGVTAGRKCSSTSRDIQQTMLSLLTGEGQDGGRKAGDLPAEFQIDGTAPGRAFQLGEILPTSANRDQWWVPVLERHRARRADADHHVRLGRGDDGGHAGAVRARGSAAGGQAGTSDAYARLVRRRRMDVSAEMEWRLTPPRTFATDRS